MKIYQLIWYLLRTFSLRADVTIDVFQKTVDDWQIKAFNKLDMKKNMERIHVAVNRLREENFTANANYVEDVLAGVRESDRKSFEVKVMPMTHNRNVH